MQKPADAHFRLRILRANSSHHEGAFGRIDDVHYSWYPAPCINSSTNKAKLKTDNCIKSLSHIPIVDLFAGPGGLGEGFSSVDGDPFRIIVSAEMESSAHKTLRLRAFYRLLKRQGGNSLDSYYRYCNGSAAVPHDESSQDAWFESGIEARQLTLGNEGHNRMLDIRIDAHGLNPNVPWVLIGGPPCQAYSVVGRVRNRGVAEYRAEDDHRHFLYKEYLRIIQKYKPSVFVMENVKGILTASVGGQNIFHTILNDLSDPDVALGEPASGFGYKIHSLSSATSFSKSTASESIDVHDFILKAEEYGIPQARHRVILLGVREDITHGPAQIKRVLPPSSFVRDAIWSMPKLRSKLSKQTDTSESWADVVKDQFRELARDASATKNLLRVHDVLRASINNVKSGWSSGKLRLRRQDSDPVGKSPLEEWYRDDRLEVWLNHEARGHMTGDLRRYAYAAAFAEAEGYSPKGHAEFALPGLRPNHHNWESGKFADRFRVQMYDRPATTVTSHISKDGHYFIHPDPAQCRSLTVREAARLQTFPDNYFFEGNRTEQFHQVGNAVPPLLARKIGEVVHSLMKKNISFANVC